MKISNTDYDAYKEKIQKLSKDELIEELINNVEKSVEVLDNEVLMEQKTEELIKQELHTREEFNQFVSEFPQVAFTQQASDFNTYMAKAEAFAKKAEEIRSVLDELCAKYRNQIEEMKIEESVSEEYMKQTRRIIKAYQNCHKYWRLAMEEYTKIIQMASESVRI